MSTNRLRTCTLRLDEGGFSTFQKVNSTYREYKNRFHFSRWNVAGGYIEPIRSLIALHSPTALLKPDCTGALRRKGGTVTPFADKQSVL